MSINTQLVYSADEGLNHKRNQMVESQILARHIAEPSVIRAMQAVPRHFFVEPEDREHAYDDCPLTIACGQTISQPYMVAKAAELLELTGTERVLEIGAGCGYQAAVLGILSKKVVALEFHAELARKARERIHELGFKNVSIHHADGKLGWPKAAPFDRILCSCSVSHLPDAWRDQLCDCGILVFPKGGEFNQVLCKWTKTKHGWNKEEIFGVRYVPLL